MPSLRLPSLKPRLREIAAFGTVFGLLLLVAPLGASEYSVRLTWIAPAQCPTQENVTSELHSLLGGSSSGHPRLEATATVKSGSGRWWLDLSTVMDGQRGHRHFEAPSCETLGEATALTLALMLNPQEGDEAESGTIEAEPALAEPAPTEPTPAEPTPDVTDQGSQQDGTQLDLGLALFLGLGSGQLPDPNVELGGSVTVRARRSSVWVSGVYGLPQSQRVNADESAGGRLSFLSIRGDICWDSWSGGLLLSPCAVGGMSQIAGRGTAIAQPADGNILWVDVGLGARAEMPLSQRWMLVAVARGGIPLARPRLFIDELGEVWRVPAVTGQVHAGAMLRAW